MPLPAVEVVVLVALAGLAIRRVLGDRGRGDARLPTGERAVVHLGRVVGKAGVHHPAVRQALPARQLEAVIAAVVVRHVGELDNRRLLERRREERDRRAIARLDALTIVAGAACRRERRLDPVRGGDALAVAPPEVGVLPVNVAPADREAPANLTIETDDELVRRVVLQVRVDRVRRDGAGRVGGRPVRAGGASDWR